MKLIKTAIPDFSRDTNTFALINTNVAAYNQYKLQRDNRNKIIKQEKEIENLSSEVTQLKDLVKQLLKDKNG